MNTSDYENNVQEIKRALKENFSKANLINFLSRAIANDQTGPVADAVIKIKQVKVVYNFEAMVGPSCESYTGDISWSPSGEEVRDA